MDTDDKMKINLLIADKYFPMTIYRHEEEYYRKAAKRVNDKLNHYRTFFPNQGLETYMTMIAMDLSGLSISYEERNDTAPFKDKIVELTQTLEDYLGQEE